MTDSDETLLTMLDLYDSETAYQAWYEVKFYEANGRLPDDARVIERVIRGADGSLIFDHRGLKTKPQAGAQ